MPLIVKWLKKLSIRVFTACRKVVATYLSVPMLCVAHARATASFLGTFGTFWYTFRIAQCMSILVKRQLAGKL